MLKDTSNLEISVLISPPPPSPPSPLPHLSSSHFTSPFSISPHLTSSHLTSLHLSSTLLTSFPTSFLLLSPHHYLPSPHLILPHPLSHFTLSSPLFSPRNFHVSFSCGIVTVKGSQRPWAFWYGSLWVIPTSKSTLTHFSWLMMSFRKCLSLSFVSYCCDKILWQS